MGTFCSQNPSITVTHIPTGEQVRSDLLHRGHTQQNRYALAKRILQSRLWALNNGVTRSDAVVAHYELPDDAMYPNALQDYRVLANEEKK
jgi:hypothetical protein